jgi:hypothetical protein
MKIFFFRISRDGYLQKFLLKKKKVLEKFKKQRVKFHRAVTPYGVKTHRGLKKTPMVFRGIC